MREQQALAAIQPQQVRVPVGIAGLKGCKVFFACSEEIQELCRASQGHGSHRTPRRSVRRKSGSMMAALYNWRDEDGR